MRRWLASATLALACSAALLACRAAGADAAKDILDRAGVREGLCLHLGAGREGSAALTAELAAGSRMLVHGLALDAASRERAEAAIVERKLLGRARAEVLPLKPLPFLPDTANLVVIEDLPALEAEGLAMDDVLRVTAPNGVVLALKAGTWTKTVKPRPKEMDDWTHTAHGPDGNRVSHDTLVQFPLSVRWMDGLPQNLGWYAECRAVVGAGGRIFALSAAEYENLDYPLQRSSKEEWLVARDAFNGLPLWKVKCATVHDNIKLQDTNAGPLATDGMRVYVGEKDRAAAYDAATGEPRTTFATGYPTFHLLLDRGVLVTAGWEAHVAPGLWDEISPKTGKGSVDAFDAATGAKLWSIPVPALQILSVDDQVYFIEQAGPLPDAVQKVVAVELKTGREKWSVPQPALTKSSDLRLSVAGSGVVVVVSPADKVIKVLSSADGKPAWEMPAVNGLPGLLTPIVGGELWREGARDLKSGKVTKKLTWTLSLGGVNGCTPGAVLADGAYLSGSRWQTYYDIRPTPATRKPIAYGAFRGHCLEGAVAANGMLYAAQNHCRCSNAEFPGFVAVGYAGEPPTTAEFEAERPVEKGPAFADVKDEPAAPTDWPTFLHDAERRSATTAKLGAGLKVLWQTPIAKPAEGPLAVAWKSHLAPCLSAPVVASGRTYVAACEEGQVIAVGADGKEVWRTTLGGRIDTPPTISRGMCVVGCHDGWVWALRASDGKLAWRARLAPRERKMVAFAQVESVWPVVGTLLDADGKLYATCGWTTESDGGVAIAALDPATGKAAWSRQVPPGTKRSGDLLALRDGKVAMFNVELDPKSGEMKVQPLRLWEPAKHYVATLGGLLDGSWTAVGTRRAGRLEVGYQMTEMLAARGDRVWGYWYNMYTRGTAAYFAEDIAVAKKNNPPLANGKDCIWVKRFPGDHQAEAMALSDGGLVLVGRINGAPPESQKGFFLVASPDDGKKIEELALSAPPAYQGVAVVEGRALVSLKDGTLACIGAK